jgi:hypothetical protein
MKSIRPSTSFTPHELKRFSTPASLAMIVLLTAIILYSLLFLPQPDIVLILYGISGIIYTLVFWEFTIRAAFLKRGYAWLCSISSGVGLGLLMHVLPAEINELSHIMVVWGVLCVTVISGRFHGTFTLLLATLVGLSGNLSVLLDLHEAVEFFAPFVLTVIVIETYIMIKRTTQQHIHRLETINKVSRQLMQSLDTQQVLALLSRTIIDTLEADSYFIGTLVAENTLRLQLMYDEGEFF